MAAAYLRGSSRCLCALIAQPMKRHAGSLRSISTCSTLLQDSHHAVKDNVEPMVGPFPTENLPLVTRRNISFPPFGRSPKQAWLESLSAIENQKLGIVDIHPDIFATFPRIDLLWWNIFWQQTFKKIRYDKVATRAEVRGGGKKPWRQKGTGRARHGSTTSPLWHKGGKAFGPRGPESYFFMLPLSVRILGLRTALSVKYAQNDLHIVDSLDLPTSDPEYLEALVESRGWGLSVLFINETDIAPKNIALATDAIKPYNVMPLYGLNVYSMLKHETLVLTESVLEQLEEKLLHNMHGQDSKDKKFKKKS